METDVILETERLILKAIYPKLIAQFFRNNTKQEIKGFFKFNDDEFQTLKQKNESGMETYQISEFYFLIISKEKNKIIGDCGFHTWNKKHHRAEIFYNLKNEEDRRKGYMTETVSKVLDFGFNHLEIHRIQAMVADYNEASLKLLENFNFQKEGISREDYLINGKNEDSVCYSLLISEWNLNKK